MSVDPEINTLIIPLNELTFNEAKRSFESTGELPGGATLRDSIERDSRFAYSIFAHRVAEVRTKAGAKKADIMPRLSEEAQEVIILVSRRPGFFQAIRDWRRGMETEDVVDILRFNVDELDPRLHKTRPKSV